MIEKSMVFVYLLEPRRSVGTGACDESIFPIVVLIQGCGGGTQIKADCTLLSLISCTYC